MTDEVIERIAEGTWVGIPDYGEGSMGAVVGGGTILVVDSTSYTVFAERFVQHVLDAEGPQDKQLVYITHRHFDHFGGAAALDGVVIGHRLTRESMALYPDDWLERNLAEWTEKQMVIPEMVRDPRIVLPEVLFDDALELRLGETIVQLVHTGGHCGDQTMAYLPRQRVLFGSDNVFNRREPYIGEGDLAVWISALRRFEDKPIDIVVPGHGPLGGAELLGQQIEQLEGFYDERYGGSS
jgi:cyclase